MEVIPEDLVYTKVLYLQWTKGCCVHNASDGPLTTKNINWCCVDTQSSGITYVHERIIQILNYKQWFIFLKDTRSSHLSKDMWSVYVRPCKSIISFQVFTLELDTSIWHFNYGWHHKRYVSAELVSWVYFKRGVSL